MVKSGEFTRVGVDEAAASLSVTLRKKGIHRNPDINAEVAPRLTPEEIEKLRAQGHVEADAPIMHYDSASVIRIDRADELGPRQVDAALAIAETLATLRELDCARVNIMGIYMGGDFEDYLKSSVLLVRQT